MNGAEAMIHNAHLIKEYNPANDPVLELLRTARPRRVAKATHMMRKKRVPSKRRKLLNSLKQGLGEQQVQGNIPLDMIARQMLGQPYASPREQARLSDYINSEDDYNEQMAPEDY